MKYSRAEHERGLTMFVARVHRQRFTDSLTNDKLRAKLQSKLAHFAWLDQRYVEEVPTPEPRVLAQRLQAEGAPRTCVLVAEDDALDGRELELEHALAAVLHSDHAALISCVPGRLAVFSDEAPNQVTQLLRRPA